MKEEKINKIIVYELHRLTRCIKDLKNICSMFEEYNCSLKNIAKEINTDIDGLIKTSTLQKELNEIEKDLEITINKIKALEDLKESMEYKQDIRTIFNLKQIEKMKQKASYVKSKNL